MNHPLLSESVVRFQSQAMSEIFPASGPVKTKILGKIDDEKTKQAARVRDHMNFLLTERMTEYRNETEKLLFSLPLAGSAFRKIYYDPNMGRPCSMFIPSEDMVVSYGAADLMTAERVTHVMRVDGNSVRKMQVSGFYRDVEIGHGAPPTGDIQEKYDKLTGDDPSRIDSRHTILEMHAAVDLPGYEDEIDGEPTGVALPYVITVDKASSEILSIRRNWNEDDEKKLKREHFVHYEYVPGLGFYGFGLIHLIGGISKSATSLLRQLVDAGTLSNLPGGLKARGLRIKGDDSPIMPGEFRDVDVPGGAIRDNITFLPYKEPSNVLYQLLGNIVEEGRRFASLTDVKISDMNQEAPVGTTLALLERSMKVMSAIQARLHAAMKREFRVLANIVHIETPDDYEYDLGGEESAKRDDFDETIDVIPVSDPNSSTMAQRIMQYQSALQLSAQAPQMYDLRKLHRQMLDVLGIQDADDIIPLEDDVKPTNPVSENMEMLNGKPAKAFIFQDHEAHIQTHMAAMQDPKIGQMLQQSPNIQAIQGAYMAHITEHLAFQYRSDIEEQLGFQLPPPDEKLPEEIEVNLSRLVSQAANQLLQKDQAEIQAQQAQQQAQDPVLQMQQQELQIKAQDVQQKGELGQAKIQAEMQKAQMRNEAEMQRMMSKTEQDQQKMIMDMMKQKAELEADMIRTVAQIQGDLSRQSIADRSELERAELREESAIYREREDSRSRERIEGAKIGSNATYDMIKLEQDKLLKVAEMELERAIADANISAKNRKEIDDSLNKYLDMINKTVNVEKDRQSREYIEGAKLGVQTMVQARKDDLEKEKLDKSVEIAEIGVEKTEIATHNEEDEGE